MNRGSSVTIVTGVGFFLFATASRPALGPIQSPIKLVPGDFPLELSIRHVKLTTHLRQVPSLKIHGTIPPLPHTFSWRGA